MNQEVSNMKWFGNAQKNFEIKSARYKGVDRKVFEPTMRGLFDLGRHAVPGKNDKPKKRIKVLVVYFGIDNGRHVFYSLNKSEGQVERFTSPLINGRDCLLESYRVNNTACCLRPYVEPAGFVDKQSLKDYLIATISVTLNNSNTAPTRQ